MIIKFLKKQFTFSLLFLALSVSVFGQNIKDLRYFGQPNNVSISKIPYGNNPSVGHYVKSGDAKIYYEVYGKGSPIVILHGGIVGSTLEMGQFIDSLSQKHQIIAISTRGHGRSTMGNTPPTYDQKSKDVAAVISEVTKEKVSILGFSDGAYTAYFFAKNYPEKINKIVAIGAGEWKKGFRQFNVDTKQMFAMDENYWKQQMQLRPEPKRINEWFSSVNSYLNNIEISKPIFEQIKCPVLLLAGEKDQNAPLMTVISAYQMLPNAQLSIIPNAPHPAFIVNFPAVWTAIIPFINE